MSSIKSRAGVLMLWSLLWLGPAVCFGQSTGPNDGQLQRQSDQLERLRERLQKQPDVRMEVPATSATDRLPDEAVCRNIQRIEFIGLSPLPSGVWSALNGTNGNDSPIGRCLGGRGAALLAQRAQNALVATGLVTTQVRVETQVFSDGRLQLTVQPGRVGRVLATSGASQSALPMSALAFGSGDILNLRDVEQTLENLRRNPSTDAHIDIAPGQAVGTSDLHVAVSKTRPWRLEVSLDNSGSRATGQWQGGAVWAWDSPLGLADQLYLSAGRDVGGRDHGPRGSRYHLLNYSAPVGYWLFGATASGNRYHQTVAGGIAPYVYSGRSRHTELQATRVLARSGHTKTSASLRAFRQSAGNRVDDTEVQVQRRRTSGWEASLSHTHYAARATWDWQLTHRSGRNTTPGAGAETGALEDPAHRWKRTQVGLTVQAPIGASNASAHASRLGRMRYDGRLRAQWSARDTPAHEHQCMGDQDTVRGFDDSTRLCATSALVWRNELAWSLAQTPHEAFAALDIGRALDRRPQTAAQGGARSLAGVGVGLRYTASPHLLAPAQTQVQAQLTLGMPLWSPDESKPRKPVVSLRVAAYSGGNAQTAITTAETAVTNNALVPVLVGLGWLADKAWTAYEVSQDIAAIRDGSKTVAQVAGEMGDEYVANVIAGNIGRYGVRVVKHIAKKDGRDVVEWGQTRPNAAQSLQAQQQRQGELVQVFDPANPRQGITMGDRSYLPKPNQAVPIYEGLSENQVKTYFRELTGVGELPPPMKMAGKVGGDTMYVVATPHGTFTLRDFAKTASQSGPVWTIDVPKTMLPAAYKGSPEIKFER